MSLQGALAALLLRGPAHGYELHVSLEGELGPLWVTRHSQVYLTLGRMQRDGLLAAKRVAQAKRPDRQVLSLTASGRSLARSWLFEEGPAEEIVVRLAVGRLVAPQRWGELVEMISAQRTASLRGLRALRQETATGGFRREALDGEVRRVEAELRWLASLADRHAEIVERPAARHGPALMRAVDA